MNFKSIIILIGIFAFYQCQEFYGSCLNQADACIQDTECQYILDSQYNQCFSTNVPCTNWHSGYNNLALFELCFHPCLSTVNSNNVLWIALNTCVDNQFPTPLCKSDWDACFNDTDACGIGLYEQNSCLVEINYYTQASAWNPNYYQTQTS